MTRKRGGVLQSRICSVVCIVYILLCIFVYTQSPYFEPFMKPRNQFQGRNSTSLCSLAGRYDNPIPTRCLAPIDCLKIPALYNRIHSSQFPRQRGFIKFCKK